MRRRWIPAVLAAGLAACVHNDITLPTIPTDAIIYVIAPATIAHHLTDTRKANGGDYEETWLDSLGFFGVNCFGLSPSAASDTIGSFVFVSTGSNTGAVRRRIATLTDTTAGHFLYTPGPGTHGTYHIDAAGILKLTWADGVAAWYFDPLAVLRLSSDTIWSNADLKFAADSLQYTWQAAWSRDVACF